MTDGVEAGSGGAPGTFLTADWRHLVLLSFAIEPALLQPHLPPGVELDDWRGTTFVSVIGFQFLHTKVHGLPIPFHRDFTEVNWRFYVRRQTPEGVRRGVVFIREFVPLPAVAFVARTLYNENYVCVRMNQKVEPGRSAAYSWTTAGKRNTIAARSSSPPSEPAPDSIEAFIVEHQWGYTTTKTGGCLEYRVERPRWRTYPVESYEMQLDPDLHAHGVELAFSLPKTPDSVIFAEGSPVSVSVGRRIA